MPSFIVFPKKSKIQEAGLGSLSTKDKRVRLFSGELFSKLIDAVLTELGFKRVTLETPVDEKTSNFMPLDHLGAYVVNVPSKKKSEEVQKSLNESDYDIVPDVQLSLPKPMCSGEIFRRRKQILWPVESGIHQAHENGITGNGVLIGVLDTGCDADHIQFRQKPIDFRYVPHHSESNNLRDVRGFDVDGHGTHVCGIIAGRHIGGRSRGGSHGCLSH